jgi:hypothetical protein
MALRWARSMQEQPAINAILTKLPESNFLEPLPCAPGPAGVWIRFSFARVSEFDRDVVLKV